MKKIALLLIIGLFLLAGRAHACMVSPPAGDALFQIFNTFFYQPGDEDPMGSDGELLSSGYFIPDGMDLSFVEAGDILRIDLTFREALFGNELGFMAGDTYHTLIDHTDIENNRINRHGTTFTVPDGFMFADTLTVMNQPLQRWYADPDLNPLGGKDHFRAFAIDNQERLDAFNLQYGTQYTAGLDDVWMIAFEDLNLGDADFTDLVAVVSRPVELTPVPIPPTALLLFSALLPVAGCRSMASRFKR